MHAGLLLSASPHRGSGLTSSRALGITVTLLRSNGDASMGLDDGAIKTVSYSLIAAELVCITGAEPRGSFWTNRAEAHGQLVLSPVRLPEQLRSSRLVEQKSSRRVLSIPPGPEAKFALVLRFS